MRLRRPPPGEQESIDGVAQFDEADRRILAALADVELALARARDAVIARSGRRG